MPENIPGDFTKTWLLSRILKEFGQWEGNGKKCSGEVNAIQRWFYRKVIDVHVATEPYRTWRKVRVQGGNIDPCGSHFILKDPF